MSAFTNKLNIGSDESTSAANRASRINSLVSRMFARANAGNEGLASQIKASSTQTLLRGAEDNMVQTTLVAGGAIRSSSYSTQTVVKNKTNKAKKTATFKLDAAQSTLKPVAKEEQPTSSATAASEASTAVPRRNLFGIRLNHDQLKQDLKDMWRDQIEQQKQRWNFDFETLRPTHKSAAQSNAETGERFKWTRVTYYTPGLPASSMAPSGFDRAELFNNSQGDYEDYESDTEQEEDDALAIPQFYKYQRRLKFNDEPSRIKMMTITVSQAPARKSPTVVAEPETKKPESDKESKSAGQMTFEPIFKMALKNSPPVQPVEKKAETKKSAKTSTIRRPKAVKRAQPTLQQSSLALSPSTQNLIITFSENRKDTLRSANAAATSTQLCTLASKVKLTAKEGETAFVSTTRPATGATPSPNTLKQQSLLDIFKQRKRRNTTISGKVDLVNEEKQHDTRSHSVAPGRENETTTSKKSAGRQSRITSSGINTHSLRSHSSTSASKAGYCRLFLRNGTKVGQ